MRVELPSDKCLGVDMQDGTSYNTRDGYVDIDRPEHLREIEKTDLRVYGRQYGFRRSRGVTCGGCGFEQLIALASNPCPRCGSAFSERGSE